MNAPPSSTPTPNPRSASGRALDEAHNAARAFLASLPDRSVCAAREAPEIRHRFASKLPLEGRDPQDVIRHLISAADGGLLGSTSGRFFAWVIGGALESALAADWLTATWDQNAALAQCSPAAAVVEEVVGGWLIELLGLPAEASFALTTGCQLAHVTCLAAARHHVLTQRGWQVEQKGLFGAPPITVVCSASRHGSVDRALRLLGWGSASRRNVPTDDTGRVIPSAFAEALSQERGPKVVVLSAGEIHTGAFDPFEDLIPLAKQHDAWVHIDGAFGLFAQASRRLRPVLRGVEQADSWASDGHKWLNVPFDCGFAFVRHGDAHRAAMHGGGSYVDTSDGTRDQLNWNPEWSRRARGWPVYAALLELGRSGVEDLVDRSCDLAAKLVHDLGALSGVEVLCRPTLNQGLVRFLCPRAGATSADHDRHTDRIIQAINASGEAYFSGTHWRGARAMRISVVNWRTTSADVDRATRAVKRALASHSR